MDLIGSPSPAAQPYVFAFAVLFILALALSTVFGRIMAVIEEWNKARNQRLLEGQREHHRVQRLKAMQELIVTANGVFDAKGMEVFLHWLEEHLEKRS